MCGRFARKTKADEIKKAFKIDALKADLDPSFNIAPTQSVLTVVQSPKGTRGLVSMKWGLVPFWAKDPSGAAKMINARSETAHEKPSFREPFKKRRCLIVANGFYEWKRGSKQPVFIHPDDQEVFGFAGLYDFWRAPEDQRLDTCTILTTAANPKIAEIHERMPVILRPEQFDIWLDHSVTDAEVLQSLLQPYSAERTNVYRVTPEVNKVGFNTPEAMQPLAS